MKQHSVKNSGSRKRKSSGKSTKCPSPVESGIHKKKFETYYRFKRGCDPSGFINLCRFTRELVFMAMYSIACRSHGAGKKYLKYPVHVFTFFPNEILNVLIEMGLLYKPKKKILIIPNKAFETVKKLEQHYFSNKNPLNLCQDVMNMLHAPCDGPYPEGLLVKKFQETEKFMFDMVFLSLAVISWTEPCLDSKINNIPGEQLYMRKTVNYIPWNVLVEFDFLHVTISAEVSAYAARLTMTGTAPFIQLLFESYLMDKAPIIEPKRFLVIRSNIN